MYLNNNYNKNLKEFARELRSLKATKAERKIWKVLLSKNQLGVRFLRQRPIDNFIVDFFSPELKLIIEIDGSSHNIKPEYDFYREEKLKKMSYRIKRFTEGDVLNNLDDVRLDLIYSIEAIKVSLLEEGLREVTK
jgi:very-short-patch-repair endonuclease